MAGTIWSFLWGVEALEHKSQAITAMLNLLKKHEEGGVWWLTPVIPALWKAKAGGLPEVRSPRSAWPKWQNPISTKNTKNKAAVVVGTYSPGYLGG